MHNLPNKLAVLMQEDETHGFCPFCRCRCGLEVAMERWPTPAPIMPCVEALRDESDPVENSRAALHGAQCGASDSSNNCSLARAILGALHDMRCGISPGRAGLGCDSGCPVALGPLLFCIDAPTGIVTLEAQDFALLWNTH